MMRETGFCSGIENYSRHLTGSAPGEPPCTLIDYFPEDFLIIVDESHITLPQVRGMYAGDRSRKSTLVEFGFRLPSALDNRPLNFSEFESKIDQMMFVSATPNVYERDHELLRVEQIIRPTGLLDPEISVRPVEGQIDDLVSEVNREVAGRHKVLLHPDQAYGRGLDGLYAGCGHPGEIPALGHRHPGAGRDHPGHAIGRVRRAGGNQPAA